LNSKYADAKPLGDPSICMYNLPQIEIPDGHTLYMSLQNAVIPYSFYCLNSTNNYLEILEGVNTIAITVPQGNYNVNQLVSYLQAQLGSTYSLVYNGITGKVTLSNTTNQFTIKQSSTINVVLGFNTSSDTPSGVSRTITGINCVNLTQIRAINVEIDMPTYNVNVAQRYNQNILATIPVVAQPFGLVNYVNPNNFRVNMFSCAMNMLKVKLVDNQANLIHLNGVNYQMTIQLDIVKFTE
jgi:hypothetical protein